MLREGVEKIIGSKNKMLLAFCFLFILGTSLASWFNIAPVLYLTIYFYAVIFILLFLVIICWEKKPYRFYFLSFTFFIFGVWRVFFVTPDCHDPSTVCFYNDRAIEITGWVFAEPDSRVDKTNYVLRASVVNGSTVTGNILVQAHNYPAYQYGDTLRLSCKLKTPENKNDSTFRYDKYLAKEGIWSLCSFPKITVVTQLVILSKAKDLSVGRSDSSAHPDSVGTQNDSGRVVRFFMKPILTFKGIVANRIDALWSEPESSFMAGVLYGSKAGLPKEIFDNFSKTGITHIIAVSGFNITIIATVLMSVLISLGLWRRQAFWVVLVVIILFTIFSGFSASAVRAMVMGVLALTAQYLGRQSRMGTALVFTAAAMALVNPFVVLWDAGFQLSFLATIGLVYISPILSSVISNKVRDICLKCTKRTDRDFSLRVEMTTERVLEPLNTTLSAIIATTPLILYQFGRLSLVAPLVNMLVLWIVPWLMLAGFVVVVLSFLFFPLAQLLAYIAGFGLKYVIMVANLFGAQSWSSINFELPWWGMVVLYILLFDYVKEKTTIHEIRERL